MMLLRRAPSVPFGVHLTMTRDSSDDRWAPVTPPDQVPSLLDRDGQLFTTAAIPQLLAQARLDEVELRAQIGAVTRSGLAPTHLDSFTLEVTGKPERYVELLRARPAGLSEWAVHPGLRDDALPREAGPHSGAVGRSTTGPGDGGPRRSAPAGCQSWTALPSGSRRLAKQPFGYVSGSTFTSIAARRSCSTIAARSVTRKFTDQDR